MTSIALAAALRLRLDAQRVVDLRQVSGLELDVDDGADDLDDFANCLCLCRHMLVGGTRGLAPYSLVRTPLRLTPLR